MIKHIAPFILLLVIAGCSPADQNKEKMDPELTYLALGDSYTIGESVADSDRWPVLLSGALTREGIPTASPRIIARTGWTTDELNEGITQADISATYDLVSLLIGVNNQYRGRDVEEFRTEFTGLLDRALAFAGNRPDRVLVVSIPDWGVTPFAAGRDRKKIAAEIDAFNGVKQEESAERKILFIDITGISRMAENDTSLIAPDGLHPSAKMYRMWVEKIMPLLAEELRGR